MPETREATPDASTEEAVDTKPAAEPAAPDTDTGDEARTYDQEYVSKLRAENAKHRTAAKEAQAKAKRLDEIENAQKSELQKANEAAEAARKELERVQLDLMKSQVASAKKLPAVIAARLQGTTREEMEADADAMLAELEKQYVSKGGAAPNATGAGVKGVPQNVETLSPKELVRMVRNREG